jgi:hypothetical protein
MHASRFDILARLLPSRFINLERFDTQRCNDICISRNDRQTLLFLTAARKVFVVIIQILHL